MFQERESIYVNDIPSAALHLVKYNLLFECNVPIVGDKASISVSRILGRADIDSACRLADSMKVRRAELKVDTMLGRLLREAKDRWRLFGV